MCLCLADAVSLFETNIRVLGGLLSAHVLSGYLQERHGRMAWYQGELLHLALDLGYRLLPAFNTSTGIPHSKVCGRFFAPGRPEKNPSDDFGIFWPGELADGPALAEAVQLERDVHGLFGHHDPRVRRPLAPQRRPRLRAEGAQGTFST